MPLAFSQENFLVHLVLVVMWVTHYVLIKLNFRILEQEGLDMSTGQ